MASVFSKVSANPQAKGLAIIITNDYKDSPEWGPQGPPEKLKELKGTEIDGRNLSMTFSSLNFVVIWHHNVDKHQLLQVMTETRYLKHKMVKDYKCIVFIFSGHGKDRNYVYLQDKSLTNICDNLIEPLLPKSCKSLGNIPKLFFIDACRGDESMRAVLVPKGRSAGDSDSHSTRGCNLVQLRVPAEGNFLVAYSTMPNYKAYEKPGEGGIWLSLVAKMIKQSPGVSVPDVLTEVRGELVKMYQTDIGEQLIQQPETLDRLNTRVCLLDVHSENKAPETPVEETSATQKKRPTVAAVFMGTSETLAAHAQPESGVVGNSHYQPQQQQPTTATSVQHNPHVYVQGEYPGVQNPLSSIQYQTMLFEFARNNCIDPPSYKTQVLFSEEHQCTYYKSSVTVTLRNGVPISQDSVSYYISQPLAQEEAAKNACNLLAYQRKQQRPPPYNPALSHLSQPVTTAGHSYSTTHAATSASAQHPLPQQQSQHPLPQQQSPSTQVSGRGLPPGGSYREKLNYFFQTNKVNPGYDYVSDDTGNQPRYRCTIKYYMNGKTERAESAGYFSSKAEAKESAAKRLLSKETKRGGCSLDVVSRGGKNTTPPDKIWKSKLKEHYDKKGQPNAQINYRTIEVSLGKFQSTVFTSDLNPDGVQGGVCDSKKEAEQSAAQRALQMLSQT